MYVLCVGLHRSGSTWQYQVASDLVERHYGGRRIGFTGPPLPPDDGWSVAKWHDPAPDFARLLGAGRARALYCYRDLRDVAFSLMHKTGETFDEMIAARRLETSLAADAFWTAQPNTLIARYEDVVRSPGTAIERIAAMLGIELDISGVLDLMCRYSLDANTRRAAQVAALAADQGVNLADPANAFAHDPESLLHWNHIRSGSVGGWQEVATPEQRRQLAATVGQWLISRGYEQDLSWTGHAGTP